MSSDYLLLTIQSVTLNTTFSVYWQGIRITLNFFLSVSAH